MCKILWNKELLLVLFGKEHTEPLTVSLGAFSQINSNIIYFTLDHTNQLVLWELLLEM